MRRLPVLRELVRGRAVPIAAQGAILLTVIPTVIIAGLLIGRWWAIPSAAVAWPVLLLTVSELQWSAIPGAAVLAAANAAVGVLPRWVLRQRSRFDNRIAPS